MFFIKKSVKQGPSSSVIFLSQKIYYENSSTIISKSESAPKTSTLFFLLFLPEFFEAPSWAIHDRSSSHTMVLVDHDRTSPRRSQ